MEKDALIATYLQEKVTLAKVEKALEVTKSRASAAVKALFDGHGKGPHLIDGREMTIVVKGETYFFLPSKQKKAADPEATV